MMLYHMFMEKSRQIFILDKNTSPCYTYAQYSKSDDKKK